MRILINTIILILIINLIACKKDETQSSSSNCSSSIPSYQDSITVGGTTYYIIAVSGTQQKFGIELIGYTGQAGVNLTLNFFQVKKGTNCYESSSSTILTGNDSKVFEFSNVPTWADDPAASAFIKVTINGNVYYLHDSNVNQ